MPWPSLIHWRQDIFLQTMLVFFLTTVLARGRRFVIKTIARPDPHQLRRRHPLQPRYYPFEQRLCFYPNGKFFTKPHPPLPTASQPTPSPPSPPSASPLTTPLGHHPPPPRSDHYRHRPILCAPLCLNIAVNINGASGPFTLDQRHIQRTATHPRTCPTRRLTIG